MRKRRRKRKEEMKKRRSNGVVNLPTNLEESDTVCEIESRWQKNQSQSLIYRWFLFDNSTAVLLSYIRSHNSDVVTNSILRGSSSKKYTSKDKVPNTRKANYTRSDELHVLLRYNLNF